MRSARIPMNQPKGQTKRPTDAPTRDPLREAEIDRGMTVAQEYAERARVMVQRHAADDAERLLFMDQIGLDE